MVRNGAMASIWMVRTQSVASTSAMSAMGPNTPAALTRMSGAPNGPDGLAQAGHGREVRHVADHARDGARGSGRHRRRLIQLSRHCGRPR